MVLECLGTKSVIARQYQELTGLNRFDWVGIDTVAAVVNDLICVGALPLTVNAYFATGSRPGTTSRAATRPCPAASARAACGPAPSGWRRVADACRHHRRGRDRPGGLRHRPGPFRPGPAAQRRCRGRRRDRPRGEHRPAHQRRHPGAARGTRAGGLTATLPDGTSIGDALLTPSAIYVDLMERLLHSGLELSYASHITGHGLRKVMRADRELTYRITQLPAGAAGPRLDRTTSTCPTPRPTAPSTWARGSPSSAGPGRASGSSPPPPRRATTPGSPEPLSRVSAESFSSLSVLPMPATSCGCADDYPGTDPAALRGACGANIGTGFAPARTSRNEQRGREGQHGAARADGVGASTPFRHGVRGRSRCSRSRHWPWWP